MSLESADTKESCNESSGNISISSDGTDVGVGSVDSSETHTSQHNLAGIKYNFRRSAIFQKRFLAEADESGALETSTPLENDSPVISQDNDILAASPGEQMPLSEYVKKLKSENVAWVTTREERKQKYYDVVRSESEVLTLESCVDILSEENKKFISEKPDYNALSQEVKNLAEMAVIGSSIKLSAIRKSTAVAQGVDKRLKRLDKRITLLD